MEKWHVNQPQLSSIGQSIFKGKIGHEIPIEGKATDAIQNNKPQGYCSVQILEERRPKRGEEQNGRINTDSSQTVAKRKYQGFF
jgi:hypothetical protein